jgi:hypothetical protein
MDNVSSNDTSAAWLEEIMREYTVVFDEEGNRIR